MSKNKVKLVAKAMPAEIARQLRELALFDFEAFCRTAGVDVVQVTICLERQKGRTMGQIANRLKLAKSTVAGRCKKCTDNPHGTSQK